MTKLITSLLLILQIGCPNTDNQEQLNNTNTPEYEAFVNQEQRFELNGCELKYNGKPFKLGMTLKEFETVFGNQYSNRNGLLEFENKNFIAWYEEENITGIKIFLNKKINEKVIVNNSILNANDRMQDFIIKSSELSFEDFFIESDGYTVIHDNCKYEYVFDSQVNYHRKGGGRLYVQGDWKLDETNPVNAITVYRSNN